MANTPNPVPLKNPPLAALLAWLVPGLGHYYQGRVGKATLYAACILGLYFIGFAIGEGKIVLWTWTNPMRDPEGFHLWYIGQFFVGLPSLPALIQGTLSYLGLDPILWGFMAVPDVEAVNALHPRLGKMVEIGKIYTTVAGLLNILAIFDAYEGPAHAHHEEHQPAPLVGAAEARA